MTTYSNIKRAGVAAAIALGAMLAVTPVTQAEPIDPSTPQTEVIAPASTDGTSAAGGKKMKLKGIVTRRDADTFTVR